MSQQQLVGGYTLIEFTIVLALGSFIALMLANRSTESLLDRIAGLEARKFYRLETAQIRCYTDESLASQQGWQMSLSDLQANSCLQAFTTLKTASKGVFSFSVSNNNLTISGDYETKAIAYKVERYLPKAVTEVVQTKSAYRVNYLLQNPYEDEVHDDFLRIDGSNVMTGSLSLDGQSITNVGHIGASGNIHTNGNISGSTIRANGSFLAKDASAYEHLK